MKKLTTVLMFASQAIAFSADADRDKVVKRIAESARVFGENRKDDNSMPSGTIKKAAGIIIVPRLTRAGFIAGAEFGKGVFVARTETGWSAPCMIIMGGGSFGFLAGVGETDLVLLAMNEEAVTELMQSHAKIGVDVMAAAGPVGRETEADTTPVPASGLLSYSHARGVFAGISVGGSSVRTDNDANILLYGRKVSESEILSGKVDPTEEAQPLLDILLQYPTATTR